MSKSPITLQLRYLQTLKEIAGEHNSTIVFPLPIDLLEPFRAFANAVGGGATPASPGPEQPYRFVGATLNIRRELSILWAS